MKKVIVLLTIFSLLIPFTVKAEDEPNLTKNAQSAVMIEYTSGDVLYKKNANERRSVASLVKMMGLILIFEKIDNGSLKTTETLTVSKTAKEMGGTQIWLEEGEKITVDDLLKGITMASANDAMVLMAERVSGTEEVFVKKMNKKVKELGLKNTHFVDATGLNEESYSCAYDMALIAKELISHDKALEYTSKYEDYIREGTDNKTWIVNTNKLTRFYPGVDGLKTGYNDKAGSTLAVTAKKDGLRLVAVSLGYDNTNTRNDEMMKLLDYGYNQYESKMLFEKGKRIKTVEIDKADEKVNLIPKEDISILNKKGENKNDYIYEIKLNNLNLPVRKGEVIGKLVLKSNNKTISATDLITDRNIEKIGIFKSYLKVIENALSGSV